LLDVVKPKQPEVTWDEVETLSTAPSSVEELVLHDWTVTLFSPLTADNPLMNFVRNDWKSLVRLFHLRYNNQLKITDHSSTQGQSSAT
jgi:hypothetical protein